MLQALVFVLFTLSGAVAIAVIAASWQSHLPALAGLRAKARREGSVHTVRHVCVITEVQLRAQPSRAAPVRRPVRWPVPARCAA